MTSEYNLLLGRTPRLTALEIRDFLTGEFEPLPAANFLDYLRASEKLGTMKLTVKPEEPPPRTPRTPGKEEGQGREEEVGRVGAGNARAKFSTGRSAVQSSMSQSSILPHSPARLCRSVK
jgi:hypothetical protein